MSRSLTAAPVEVAAPRKGARTRRAILERAAALATLHGLEQLSIGMLAEDLGMSKSGLFAHFGSKEELQLATVEHARDVYVAEVIAPALARPREERLDALLEAWLSYARRCVFPGGCFFAAASTEFAGRSGPVRARVVELMDEWVRLLERAAAHAGARDASALAFELFALMHHANWSYQVFGDAQAFDVAAAAIEERLRDR